MAVKNKNPRVKSAGTTSFSLEMAASLLLLAAVSDKRLTAMPPPNSSFFPFGV